MAKIRVYELARDLNMTNKDLLEKLKENEVVANSHMSSLDEDVVLKIKSSLLGKKESNLEETRIRPTVIRRRRRIANEHDVEENETHLEEEVLLEDEGEADAPYDEAVEFEKEIIISPPPPPQEKKIKTPEELLRPKYTEASAKVISRPAKEIPVEETKIPPEAKVRELQEEIIKPENAEQPPADMDIPEITMVKEAKSNPKTQETELKKVEDTKETPLLPEKKEENMVVSTEEIEKHESPIRKEHEQDRVKSQVKALPKSKKHKKEMPAKIIKLPVPPKPPVKEKINEELVVDGFSEPENREKNRIKPKQKPRIDDAPILPVKEKVLDEKADALKAAKGKEKWKKVKKKRGPEDFIDSDKNFLNKKVAFRKKEVIESDVLYSGKNRGKKKRKVGANGVAVTVPAGKKTTITQAKAIKRRVKIDDTIVLSDLAKRMGIKANEMIAKLMSMNVMATVNQTIDFETAVLVASEFDYEVERASFEEDTIIRKKVDSPESLQQRPPVVTIMGHVDHGKTSLLDVIRKTRVTASEAGGITQHIGAYHVQTDKGQIVFLDTPGHEAFSAMRSRGAKVTDIVVLVVAADDGIMPQTVEAINHAKVAEVPIIVAINKMDKAGADSERVQRQLSDVGLVPEDWGGETIFVRVSAKKNEGIDDLLEMILLQAEVMELKANPDKLAVGHVVEAKLDSGRGPVATVLVYDGTLKTGDPVVCGLHHGKVRALLNDRGEQVQSAGPSIPVEIIGLSGVPMAGDEFVALSDEKDAKQVSLHRIQKQRAKQLAKTSRLSLDKLYEKMKEGEVKDLNLIVKTDVEGSIEALKDTLVKLSNDEVNIRIIHSATGTITESDISLAAVSNAIIIGFNVRANQKVQELANEEHVDIRYYNVIYNVIKEIKSAIVGLMESTYEERILGRADVRQTFHVPKIGAIAGSYVLDGKIERGKNLRLIRDGIVVYEGKCGSLRRFKDDAKEVNSGYECGIGIENFNDIKVNDIIECYYYEEIKPNIE